jgi:hypothetical protein
MVGVLFCMALTNSSSSLFMAFTSGTCGLAIAMVRVPFGVSSSKLNALASLSSFSFIISAVLLRKSIPM